MISPNVVVDEPAVEAVDDQMVESEERPACLVLVRYGQVPVVARFGVSQALYPMVADQLNRGGRVVVNTDRGVELGSVLERLRDDSTGNVTPTTGDVLRAASAEDLQAAARMADRSVAEFSDWENRITNWKLQLQLVDLEWTLDGKHVVLYVLNGQDAEVTRLALLAAAAGLGIVHVQPVLSDGPAPKPTGGGCGSGGCGSGGCSS
ncbi:MAG: hypothetical protein R3C59_20010 [Planctomycetaceae bacterium]